MKTEYIVEMTHITKTFPGVRALDDVSFNLKSGEVLALLGENGAGKSTLMKVLSGVYTRDGGEITAFGNKVEKMTPKRAASSATRAAASSIFLIVWKNCSILSIV